MNPRRKLFPALIARMGDWSYYISFMSMGEVSERVSIVQDIHHETALQDLLQRGLTKNADKISAYLQMQSQRFFNAIVVGAYGGRPEWHEVAVKPIVEPVLEDRLQGALGFLELSGDETLFAIDGQHRVAGIKKALKEDPALAEEEIAVIFVKGVAARKREYDPDGFQRTRRLFTTLNRNAKPVQKKDIIALDEDDVTAIIARQFLEQHPLFKGKTSVAAAKSIPRSDQRNVTSIVTLYDVIDLVIRDRVRGWADFKKLRPPEEEIAQFYKKSEWFWELLCKKVPPLSQVRQGEPSDDLVARYRHQKGGNILFRPVGLLVFVRAIIDLTKQGVRLRSAVAMASRVPLELAQVPWKGLLWDKTNNRMLTDAKHQRAARRLLFFMSGGEVDADFKKQLRKDLAGARNLDVEEIDPESMMVRDSRR